MKTIALISISISGLLLISSANADQAEANSQNSILTRDHTAQIVTDSSTKLQWEDNAKEPVETTWPKADKHCSSLNFAGHTDWRLPTAKELKALAKATKVKFPKEPILKSIPTFNEVFWTSDAITDITGTAVKTIKFDVFDYGKTQLGMQNLNYSVRCVRNSK